MNVDGFILRHMRKGKRFVAARLQTAIALLERLRTNPSLRLDDHLASKGSSGLESHETYGQLAHDRLALEPINKNHGRRSSSLQDWGQELLDLLNNAGFSVASQNARQRLIDETQATVAARLREILEQEPFKVRLRGRSAEAIIGDVLSQADEKGKCGDVAQYLVGAKLALRFDHDVPVLPANKADRKSRVDPKSRLGDFELGSAVIEVAMGLPDEKHVVQITEALEDVDLEVWLLTRADRVATWKNELRGAEGVDFRRVVVASVEAFVGQNITELGGFSAKGKQVKLQELFELYNNRWIRALGTPGMRIEAK